MISSHIEIVKALGCAPNLEYSQTRYPSLLQTTYALKNVQFRLGLMGSRCPNGTN